MITAANCCLFVQGVNVRATCLSGCVQAKVPEFSRYRGIISEGGDRSAGPPSAAEAGWRLCCLSERLYVDKSSPSGLQLSTVSLICQLVSQ